MTQATKTRLVSIFLAFVLGVCVVITTAAQIPLVARAESITYSNVLDDLKKDTSFKPENYPTKADDYSLQIIQLAESVNKELFVYVYQPSGKAKDFKASSINISTTINDSISYLNYKLELLNSNGVFYKYKVSGFTVKDESVRYYAISSIYRPFDESIDKQASGGNTVTEVNYAVNKQYAFGSINGKPYVNCVDIETIVVTDKFVGFVRYKDGFKLYVGACDSHFVAFNTDKPIDKLLEADVYYTTQSYDWSSAPFVGVKETFGDKADKYAYLKYTDKVEHTGDGWFAGTYKWDRIQTIDDFIKGENRENIYHGAVLDVKTSSKLTDEALNELKGKKWVLRFAETNYSLNGYASTGSTFESYTLVGDVTILRLKFETDDCRRYGLTYDDALKTSGLFDVLETYAQAFFIYALQTSLIVANYSIRTDNRLLSEDNFPLWALDFFSDGQRRSRHSHILDFDVLRLGKKVLENNPKAGSFEFGVVAITEIGKERGNNLELKEVKKKNDETNQKNDLFNSWLKMCRHSATVDNFPFIKVFTDEQRPESWGADARDLCDIVNIVSAGDTKLALPFYTIEDMVSEIAFNRFIALYYDFRYRRGDNTLLVHILKSITAWLWKRNTRIYNKYGYSIVKVEKERGTMDGNIRYRIHISTNGSDVPILSP